MPIDQETFLTEIRISAQAEIDLSERGKSYEWGGHDTTKLVEAENKAELSVRIDEESEEGMIVFALSTYHVEDMENGRTFHCRITTNLSIKQIASLNRFLTYLMEIQDIKS